MNKTFKLAGIAAIVTSLSFTTASGVLASSTPNTNDLTTLGSTESSGSTTSNLSAEIHAAKKDETKNLLSLTWSIKNNGSEDNYVSWARGTSYMYTGPYFSGVTITPSNGERRYHPVMDENGNCLCSGAVSADFKDRVSPGEQVAYWSMYSVPEDVDTITLEIPGFEPIKDIPIS